MDNKIARNIVEIWVAPNNQAMHSIFYGRRILTEVFSFVGGKKIKIKIYLLAVVGKFGLFSRDSDDFLTENLPTL